MKLAALLVPLSLWGSTLGVVVAPLAFLVAEPHPTAPAKTAVAKQDASLERGGPARRALLIGVSGYAHGLDNPTYGDLNTQPDIWAMKKTLMTRFGFKNNEILVLLTPKETTHQGIVTAIQKFLLEQTKPGDIVYIHYSGHGDSLPAPKGSNRPGGTVQTLVPSDWKEVTSYADPAKALKDSNQITDTELVGLLQTLKDKNKPSSVTLSFDCCHSGLLTTGVRGAARMLVRTRNPNSPGGKLLEAALAKVAKESVSPLPSTVQISPLGRGGNTGTRGGNLPLLGDAQSRQLGFATFSACRYDQTDKETMDDSNKPMGSLTYFLCKAFNEAKPDTTVRDVFERINGLMTTTLEDQNPVIDGDTNNLLLKGVALPPEPYAPTRLSKNSDNNDTLVLESGTVLGVSKGSVYDLYAPGTKKFGDKSMVVASAVVESVGLNESVLRITTPGVTPAKADATRAVEASHAYEDNRLRVDASALKETPQGKLVLAALQKYDSKTGLVNFDIGPGEVAQVRILPSGSRELAANSSRGAATSTTPSYSLLKANDGTVFRSVPASAQGDKDAETLIAALVRESKAQFVRTLANPDLASSNITIEMTVVPCEVDNPSSRNARFVRFKGKAKADGKDNVFEAGSDWVTIRLKNTGSVKAYYSVLDIDPTGRIGGLWPRRGDNNTIEPGQEIYLSSGSQIIPIHLTEPAGKEMFKVIATPNNTDMSALFSPDATTRGSAPGGNAPISKLLRMTSEGKRAEVPAPPESWATAEASFIVLPKK